MAVALALLPTWLNLARIKIVAAPIKMLTLALIGTWRFRIRTQAGQLKSDCNNSWYSITWLMNL